MIEKKSKYFQADWWIIHPKSLKDLQFDDIWAELHLLRTNMWYIRKLQNSSSTYGPCEVVLADLL